MILCNILYERLRFCSPREFNQALGILLGGCIPSGMDADEDDDDEGDLAVWVEAGAVARVEMLLRQKGVFCKRGRILTYP